MIDILSIMSLCGPWQLKAPSCSEGLSLPSSTLIMRVMTGDIFLQSFTLSWIVLLNPGALLACDQSQQTDRKEGNIAELSSCVCFNLAIFLIHNAVLRIFPI